MKEENSAPPVGLEPTTSCLHDKGTTTRAKGEPQVIGRGSGSYPVEGIYRTKFGMQSDSHTNRCWWNSSYIPNISFAIF